MYGTNPMQISGIRKIIRFHQFLAHWLPVGLDCVAVQTQKSYDLSKPSQNTLASKFGPSEVLLTMLQSGQKIIEKIVIIGCIGSMLPVYW